MRERRRDGEKEGGIVGGKEESRERMREERVREGEEKRDRERGKINAEKREREDQRSQFIGEKSLSSCIKFKLTS